MHDRAILRRAATALITAGMVAATFAAAAAPALAQAWDYPSFQQSHVVNREFNFAVATSGVAGTSFLVQWREGVVPGQQQFSVDAGLAAPSHAGGAIGFFGGTYAYQLTTESTQQPLEVLGTGGANLAFGDGGTVFRIPVGVSVGHRFPLEGDMAVTPYVHPRIAIEFCSECGTHGNSRSELGLGFGFGANLEVTRQIALRLDTSFGFSRIASSDASVGLGLAWSPMGLRKPR